MEEHCIWREAWTAEAKAFACMLFVFLPYKIRLTGRFNKKCFGAILNKETVHMSIMEF